MPILASKPTTDWDTAIDALVYTMNSHTMRISSTREQTLATERLLVDRLRTSKRHAIGRDIGMAGEVLERVISSSRWQAFREENVKTYVIT